MTPRTGSESTASQDPLLLRRSVAVRLQSLRTHAYPRLTQQAAAAYIGLSESTGRRSIGQWESGEVVPHSSWRLPMLRYLWCALGLAARPTGFADLWTDLASAWEWDPLSDLDWQYLHALACNDDTATLPSPTPAGPQADPLANSLTGSSESLFTAPPAAPAQPVLLAAPPRFHFLRRWLPIALIAGALLLPAAVAFLPDFIVANPLLRGAAVDQAAYANLGFEMANGLAPWTVTGDPACAHRQEDAAAARTGRYYLHIDTAATACGSLRYDLVNPPAVGATARFAVWARAAHPAVETVELVLWPGRRTDGDPIVGAPQSARFTLDDQQWRCLEVSLPIADPHANFLRAEVYFDPAAPVQVDLDEASLHFNGRSACREEQPQFTNPSFEFAAGHLGWSFTPGDRCTWEDVNTKPSGIQAGTQARAGTRYLRVASEGDACASLYQVLTSAPLPGVTYRARAWVRAETATPVRVSWALWALGSEDASAAQRMVVGREWRCVEVALPVPLDEFDRLRAELHFDTPGTAYAIDDTSLSIGDQPLCPPQPLLLNPGFEASDPAPWEELDHCLVDSAATPEEAAANPAAGTPHSGTRFVRAHKTAECYSIFQDVFTPIHGGDAATFSLWVRAGGATPARGQLALRAIGATTELAELPFTLATNDWACLEVSLTAQAGGHEHWRPEVYFTTEGALFDVDDADLARGTRGACPQMDYALQQVAWLPGVVAYPGSGLSGLVEVENAGDTPGEWPHSMRYWLSATRSGPPLYDEASGSVVVLPLAPQASSGPLYFDLMLPPSVKPGKTYYLVMETGSTSSALGAGQRRRALPFYVEPCSADTLFCDIPQGFWARAEAERWYELGVTSGCRSETQPFRDLPFCPQQTLSPDTMAIFLVRHLVDPAFRPTAPYAGIYADVPESHRRSMWIEALYKEISFVARSNCPQVPGELRFCPSAPLLRQDLLRYLAAALERTSALDPAPMRDPHATDNVTATGSASYYVDLADQPELATVANAMHAAGILPDEDPACPDLGRGPRFCPDAPALRIDAAVWMVRAFTP